jgi:alkanesulfonate monooxygenase SsuD/methylene tetrahydromethanopterin reductase-like flavin-dependent oxidoreductase (luciferase family)
VHAAVLVPPPKRQTGPRILMAGRGRRRSLPLAARHADDWNVMFVTPERFSSLNAELEAVLRSAGRQPTDIRRTVMVGVDVGRTPADVEAKLQSRAGAFWRTPGLVAGTPPEVRDRLAEWRAAGAQRVILQWLDLDDLDSLQLLADAVAEITWTGC